MDCGISVHELSHQMYANLSVLRGWEETKIAPGQAIEAHRHGFNAMYFTDGVKYLYSEGKKIGLPKHAAVFIGSGVEHAWSGVAEGNTEGIVGYIEPGHGGHKVVAEY